MSEDIHLHDFDVRNWPGMRLDHRRQIMSSIVNRYYIPDKKDYDATSLEDELSQNIVILLEQTLQDLNQRRDICDPIGLFVRGVNAFIRTKIGQAYACSHEIASITLLRCLHVDSCLSNMEILDTLQTLLRLVTGTDGVITRQMQSVHASSDILVVMKRLYASRNIHEAGRRILHYLGMLEENRKDTRSLTRADMIVDLINTPHAMCKESALHLLSLSFHGNRTDMFKIGTGDWQQQVLPHFCRLLFFSTKPTQEMTMYTAACFLLVDSAATKYIVNTFASALVVSILDLPTIIDLLTTNIVLSVDAEDTDDPQALITKHEEVVLAAIKAAFTLCEERHGSARRGHQVAGDEGATQPRRSRVQLAMQSLWKHLREGKLHLILLTFALQKLHDRDGLFDEVFSFCVDSLLWYTELFAPAATPPSSENTYPTGQSSLQLFSRQDPDDGAHSLAALRVSDALFILQRWVCEDPHARWDVETHIETFASRSHSRGLVSMEVQDAESSITSVVDLLRTLRSYSSSFSQPVAAEGDRSMSLLISTLKHSYPLEDLKHTVRNLAKRSLLLDSSTIAPINSWTVSAGTAALSLAGPSQTTMFNKSSSSPAPDGASQSPSASFLPPLVPHLGSASPSASSASISIIACTDDAEEPAYTEEGSPAAEETYNCSQNGQEKQLLQFGSANESSSKGRLLASAAGSISGPAGCSVAGAPRSSSPSAALAHASLSYKRLVCSPGVPGQLPPPTPPQTTKPQSRGRQNFMAKEPQSSENCPSSPCDARPKSNMENSIDMPKVPLVPSPPKSPNKSTTLHISQQPVRTQHEDQQRFVRKRFVG